MNTEHIPIYALAISLVALTVSIVTTYLTLFRRGTVRMTRPTTIYFGPDGRGQKVLNPRPKPPKVYLRSLIYSTAKRGHILESMFVTLRRGETQQTFNIWVYGEGTDLKRGSGLFVGDNGVTFNHHFTPPKDGSGYVFLPGDYQVDVYAFVIGRKQGSFAFNSIESQQRLFRGYPGQQ